MSWNESARMQSRLFKCTHSLSASPEGQEKQDIQATASSGIDSTPECSENKAGLQKNPCSAAIDAQLAFSIKEIMRGQKYA
jgi:hypothetical protein